MGGSDKKASLWTKEGVRLTTIAERDDWVWCCAPRPNANYVAIGTNDGAICMYQLMFSTVHCHAQFWRNPAQFCAILLRRDAPSPRCTGCTASGTRTGTT